jgi:hypothetical protein
MPHYEQPLTPEEQQELQRIRRNRQIRRQRAEINDANYWSGWGKILLFLLAWFAATWPCYVWHGQPHSDTELPSSTGWVIESIWLAVVVLPIGALIIYGRRAEKRRAAEKATSKRGVH